MSDRWLPVSPVSGAVDAFEWKAPVDAIGRGDDTLMIEPGPGAGIGTADEPPSVVDQASGAVVDVTPAASQGKPGEDAAPKGAESGPSRTVEPEPKPPVFVPSGAPDDPGVAQPDPDESPTSLERLRAAQFR